MYLINKNIIGILIGLLSISYLTYKLPKIDCSKKINHKENENRKFLSLITKKIFKNAIKCKTNLNIINLAWDSDKKNSFNYYPDTFEIIKNNLLDLYLSNQNLWKNIYF